MYRCARCHVPLDGEIVYPYEADVALEQVRCPVFREMYVIRVKR